LVKACHVVIFVPLDPTLPHFVFRMQMSTSGAHTPDVERGVAQTIANGMAVGLKGAGRGNDGERSHYDIVMRAGPMIQCTWLERGVIEAVAVGEMGVERLLEFLQVRRVFDPWPLLEK
jgi:hypothetical protein